MTNAKPRTAAIDRKTRETSIAVSLDLDGAGETAVNTGIGFFDHMLDHLGRHGLLSLKVQATGDSHVDFHHTVEDVGICLGQAIAKAVGDKRGIRRYGWASVPMEETLANVAVDLSGRPFVVFNVPFATHKIGQFDVELVEEFCRALANNAALNLHINVPYGGNDHHVAEAIFKSLGQALRAAVTRDARVTDVPSTKGTL
ncbi:MAG: imidazoleglycerol-phosphate dehydratase HisB [Phycisphaerae bacterium]|nr:imidazoleglycerol-phosphate dehydratase HisB [Phycisphaerae bacterium]